MICHSTAYTIFNVYFPKLVELRLGTGGGKSESRLGVLWDVVIFTVGGMPGAIVRLAYSGFAYAHSNTIVDWSLYDTLTFGPTFLAGLSHFCNGDTVLPVYCGEYSRHCRCDINGDITDNNHHVGDSVRVSITLQGSWSVNSFSYNSE